MVEDSSISFNTRRPLMAKVANAEVNYGKEKYRAAVNELKALNNSVEAQRYKKLTNTQADNIVFLSNQTISLIEQEN